MNVLKPELIWIDSQCYRLLGNGEWSNNCVIHPYVEDNDKMDCCEFDVECQDLGFEIEPHGSNRFKHEFSVSKLFFPHIVGSKHATLKRLETETRTQISIPRVGQDGVIEIFGYERSDVVKARHRIGLLVEAARKKIRPTHFLSIPLNEEQTIMKFEAFKSEVLANSGRMSRGVGDTIFQTPSKLHLTIEVITLLDDEEMDRAMGALIYCRNHIVKPAIEKHGQIPIRIQGTEIMNDDPGKAKILYAKVIDESGVLQEIVNSIASYYGSIGLVQRKRDQVKLHVTLMNTKFKFHKEEWRNRSSETFDASEVLKIHENTDFGETTLKQIDISQFGTISSAGYYEAMAKINLLEGP